MQLSTQPYKGARDFYPKDKQIQNYIFDTWKKVALSYGYQQYDAPIIEPIELYSAKTSEEIVSEQTYAFQDRGGRQVTLRPEMTPTVSRMVAAKRQELAYPARLFSIPNVWRYERPQRGRLREHWQLNVDLFGIEGLAGDHEVISLADSVMQAFQANRNDYVIKLNSRKLVNYILTDYLKLDEVEVSTIIRLIDRMPKMDKAEFLALLDTAISPTQRETEDTTSKLVQILQAKSLQDLPEQIQQHPSAQDLQALESLLKKNGITNAFFDISLMRGFDYYTDIVFEVFDTNPDNNRSLFGGGRYDGLVGTFGVEPIPTIGFGMGDVTIKDFLETHSLLPQLESEIDAVVILVGDVYLQSQDFINTLRSEGARIAVDSTDKKMDKKLKSAFKAGYPYAIFVGEQELADGQYAIKDLKTSKDEKHSPERLVQILLSRRNTGNNI